MPKILNKNTIHGDFTLDNMIFKDDKFFLIDISPTNLNSIELEYNKLMQDLISLWFVRNENQKMNYNISCQRVLDSIDVNIKKMYNVYLNIFMLLRVLPYAFKNNNDRFLLINEINKLWK